MANERARTLRRNRTRAEKALWKAVRELKSQGYKFRQQAPIDPYIVDLVCLSHRLIIEIDGATHSTAAELASDAQREAFLKSQGFRIMRVWNNEVFENLDGVLRTIYGVLQEPLTACPRTPTPGPSPQGGGEKRPPRRWRTP